VLLDKTRIQIERDRDDLASARLPDSCNRFSGLRVGPAWNTPMRAGNRSAARRCKWRSACGKPPRRSVEAPQGDLERGPARVDPRDERELLRLADTGCVIEFDLFGQEQSYYRHADIDMPNDAQRLKFIRCLIDHGHLERVVISHDICHQTRLTSFGGHGYGHIYENVIPLMRSRGFSESEINAILIENPRRLLTFV
jgi:Phosphotriesterase family